MASVRYFGGLWMTFNEDLQGQISACLDRTYICIIYTVRYIGHYISTLYITYIRHYISALFNLSFMSIHCHKR